MKYITKVFKINKRNPEHYLLDEAVETLKSGGLVAFPTETVYGLGAVVFNNHALRRIFTVKGRPQDNPLIVHVGYKKDAEKIAEYIPPYGKKLIRNFWPGPVTLIVRKKRSIPNEISGGLDTVAIRMPDNKIAQYLIRRTGMPIAAPSANLSGRPSPTSARHVLEDLYGKVDLIVDGGRTRIGIESTVIDCTQKIPVILRPGSVNKAQLERIVGKIDTITGNKKRKVEKPISPGLKYRHYAPRAPLLLFLGDYRRIRARLSEIALDHSKKGIKVGILSFVNPYKTLQIRNIKVIFLGKNKKNAEKRLFDTLRLFNNFGVDIILSESFPEEGAISNRLKCASVKIIYV